MLWFLTSLMLTPAEDTHATTFLTQENTTPPIATEQASSIAPDAIQISALLYVSPSQWVTWINGHKMRPSSLEGDGFRIQKVDTSSVTITLTQHGDRAFVLSPGESLNRSTGHIEDKAFIFPEGA